MQNAQRQSVRRVAANEGIFEMQFERVEVSDVHDFILHSKSIQIPNKCDGIEDGAWKNLYQRSKSGASSKNPMYAIDIRDSFFQENEPWNLNRLRYEHSIIHEPDPSIADAMDGIQNSYVNIGMLFT